MNSSLKQRTTSTMKGLLLGLIGMVFLSNGIESLAQEPMSPGKYKAPMKYAVQLPQYCWAQYFGRTEPQYSFPSKQLCGAGMNHFCGGLVELMKARDTSDKGKKIRHFKVAKKEFLYTKRWMEPYPRCPLRPHMERALAEADAGLMVFSR